MKRSALLAMTVGIAATLPLAANAGLCENGDGPQAAVHSYITAMQESRFKDAYDFVTTNMTDGRVREEWAGMQKLFFEAGGVSIYAMDVRNAHAPEDDPSCTARATVPNILKSRDKFNNQGTTEFELYFTTLDGESWKVDGQETLFDEKAIREWFPEEEIPEFRDQY